MDSVNNVLIVGGGIGGLCAAIALRRKGIAVDLVELKTEWTVYGVGIIQQSNVVREMHRLGLLDAYLDAAYAFEDVAIYTTEGQQLARIPGSAWLARITGQRRHLTPCPAQGAERNCHRTGHPGTPGHFGGALRAGRQRSECAVQRR